MKVFLKIILASTVSVGFIFAIYYALTRHEFTIQQVNVVLQSEKDPTFLFSRIKTDLKPRLARFLGQPIWSVDLEKVLDVVAGDRRIRDVRVSRRLPNKLVVSLSPRAPIANILGKDSNVFYPLSKEGTIFPPMTVDEIADAPILRGVKFLNEGDLRKLVLSLLEKVPSTGEFSLKTISEIYEDKDRGLVLVLSPDGTEVIIGREDFHNRIHNIQRVVQYLRAENLKGRVIDARFSKKVVVKLRNAS